MVLEGGGGHTLAGTWEKGSLYFQFLSGRVPHLGLHSPMSYLAHPQRSSPANHSAPSTVGFLQLSTCVCTWGYRAGEGVPKIESGAWGYVGVPAC